MSKRPNILHIFCDQLRFDVFGFARHPVIKTPHLDRLAVQGTVFDHAYTPSPVSVPARCCMIHGQYVGRTGCFDNGRMCDDRQSFMDGLTAAGYRTHGIGKCHFTPDRAALRGLQSRQSQEEGVAHPSEDDYLQYLLAHGIDHLTDPHGVRGEMYYMPQPSQVAAKHHPTQWVGDQAVAFLSDSERRDQPWYLYASFIHPHPPFAPPMPWHHLYHNADMPLPRVPDDVEQFQTHINRVQNHYKYRDRGWDLNVVRQIRAYYFSCVSFIDYQVGRMLDALDASGQADDTLVIFTSDHGEHLGDYRCFGKRSMHDTASRVPMIARMPGTLDEGATVKTPVSLVDLAPTFLNLAEGRIDSHDVDGDDLLTIARSERDSAPQQRYVFSQYAKAETGSYMVYDGRLKLYYSAADRREILFDHGADPLEQANAIDDASHEDDITRLRTALFDHLRETGQAETALDGDAWREYPRPEEDDSDCRFRQVPKWADLSIPGYTG